MPERLGFGTGKRAVRGFGTADKTKAGLPKEIGLLSYFFSMISGATRRDRTGDLLITKNTDRLQSLQRLHADRSVINNLGNLLSLKQ